MFSRFKNNVKVTKDVGWLLPGLEVKRWFLLIFFGSIMIVLGFMVLANVRPIYLTLELIRKAAYYKHLQKSTILTVKTYSYYFTDMLMSCSRFLRTSGFFR